MRRTLAVLLGLGLLLGMAGPASSIERVSKAQSLNAFWYFDEPVGPNAFRQTTWYVGAFRTTGKWGGTFSDLYQSVDLCRNSKRGTVCTNESFAIGYRELVRGEFWIDESRLNTGFIDATYDLQTYDATGRSVGKPVPTHIRTDFEGEGPIERSRFTEVYEDENFVFTFTFHGFFRTAGAYGWIDGVSIGETYDAYMSLSTSAEAKRKA